MIKASDSWNAIWAKKIPAYELSKDFFQSLIFSHVNAFHLVDNILVISIAFHDLL
jgi:hypothetical protein